MTPEVSDDARPAPLPPSMAPATGGPIPDAARQAQLEQLGQQAMRAFWRDLPQLLQERYRQWVAYHGDRQLGFGRTRYELYAECFRQGFDPEEILIRSIEEELPGLVIGNPPPEEWPDECMEL